VSGLSTPLFSAPSRLESFHLLCFRASENRASKPADHNQGGCAAHKSIKQQPAQTLEPIGLTRGFPLGYCNGLFSAGIPTGVRGHASSNPTNQLPNSTTGRPKRPPGSTTALLPTVQDYQTRLGFASACFSFTCAHNLCLILSAHSRAQSVSCLR